MPATVPFGMNPDFTVMSSSATATSSEYRYSSTSRPKPAAKQCHRLVEDQLHGADDRARVFHRLHGVAAEAEPREVHLVGGVLREEVDLGDDDLVDATHEARPVSANTSPMKPGWMPAPCSEVPPSRQAASSRAVSSGSRAGG